MDTKLDDTTKTAVYIPYNPTTDNADGDDQHVSAYAYRDLPDGPDLRLAVYRAAWGKSLAQIKAILESIYKPVVDSVVRKLNDAYADTLPALPYPEIPVVSVSVPSAGPSFMDAVNAKLEHENYCVTHLYPTSSSNVMNAMKALILGFIGSDPDPVKRKASTSLAVYDITLLAAWFEAQDTDRRPKLIVILHDFESFNPPVMQDVWEICSMHTSDLPLTFLLTLSSPASSSYIQKTYPRSTLALLRVRLFEMPGGNKVLEEVLERMYFDPMFEPPIILGPPILEFLGEYFGRWNGSVDGMISVLQLVHMHHFKDPLTLFNPPTPRKKLASRLPANLATYPFLDALLSRLTAPSPSLAVPANHVAEWTDATLEWILDKLEEARGRFWEQARNIRVAWSVWRLAKRFLDGAGASKREGRDVGGSGHGSGTENDGLVEAMGAFMRGRGERQLAGRVRKLGGEELKRLLEELGAFFDGIGDEERLDDLKEFIERLEVVSDNEGEGEDEGDVAAGVEEWVISFISGCMTNLEEWMLWDIWYTGGRGFPSELINPSVRASVLSGLTSPRAYLSVPLGNAARGGRDDEIENDRGLSCLPDTSILFRRYLDSGKVINVWDWYESFVAVCEDQREESKKAAARRKARRGGSRSPTKASRNKSRPSRSTAASPVKPKRNGKDVAPRDDDDSDERDRFRDGEEDGEWGLQTQARFMRALHELDYIGLIRHTGRKKDCVMRTVWEGEWEEDQ